MTSCFKISSIIGTAYNPRRQIRERDSHAPSFRFHLNDPMLVKRHYRQLITHTIEFLYLFTPYSYHQVQSARSRDLVFSALRISHQVQSTRPQDLWIFGALRILKTILLFILSLSQKAASPYLFSTVVSLRDVERHRFRLNIS